MHKERHTKIHSHFRGLAYKIAVIVKIYVRAESHALGKHFFVVTVMLDYGHLVLSERTGFIRADYLCATESFNCGEFADDGIFL